MQYLIEGTLSHEDGFWLAEIEELDALTQGENPTEAAMMAADWIKSMLDDDTELKYRVRSDETAFQILVTGSSVLALILERQRQLAIITGKLQCLREVDTMISILL